MRFDEITSRLTGISTPIFGISWNPPEAERAIAQKIIIFLEDRRVLYNPSDLEVPDHCVRSVLQIRDYLTYQLADANEKKEFSESLRAMRAACRKFLDTVGHNEMIVRFANHQNHYASWVFNSALGELRGVFGIHIAKLAAQYGLDVEDELASILPNKE